MNRDPTAAAHPRTGLALGLSAYALWGILPLYFKAIEHIPPVNIVAHRVLWSAPLLALMVAALKRGSMLRQAATRPRTIGILVLTAILIATNWLLYVWAVTNGHILAASFGYYLNPLANVLLGRFVLNEKLNRRQWIAVAIAAAGISILAAGALSQLWISLALCASFALYGLFRKIVAADALVGLTVETAILLPPAMLWLGYQAAQHTPVMGTSAHDMVLLLLAGIVSTTPLLLFTAAAKRLPLSTMGMLQFIAPTLQFMIAIVYGEPLKLAHFIAFPAIWLALVLYTTALFRSPQLPQPPE
jgi:chloramphenicol-sensitive protein RarD